MQEEVWAAYCDDYKMAEGELVEMADGDGECSVGWREVRYVLHMWQGGWPKVAHKLQPSHANLFQTTESYFSWLVNW